MLGRNPTGVGSIPTSPIKQHKERRVMEIITNNVPRLLIDGYDLTEEERKKFDYDVDEVAFFRYKGEVYDLGDFDAASSINGLKEWDGYMAQAFYFGLVIKWVREDGRMDYDRVIVGRYCT
jgi:hypothetical protein